MNAKQAYEILSGGTNDFKQTMDAIAVAAHALQKQIPQKPIKGGLSACPNCRTLLLYGSFEAVGEYCKYCGQAIDWSDKKSTGEK